MPISVIFLAQSFFKNPLAQTHFFSWKRFDKSVLMVEFQICVFEVNLHRKGNFQENSSTAFPTKKMISHAKIVFRKNKVSSELPVESISTFFFVLKAKFQFQGLLLSLKKKSNPPQTPRHLWGPIWTDMSRNDYQNLLMPSVHSLKLFFRYFSFARNIIFQTETANTSDYQNS